MIKARGLAPAGSVRDPTDSLSGFIDYTSGSSEPVSRFTTFGNRRHHQIGTAHDIAAGKDFRVTGLECVFMAFRRNNTALRSSSTSCFASHSMLCGRKTKRHHHRIAGTTCSGLRRSPRDDAPGIRLAHLGTRRFSRRTLPLAFTSTPRG